MSMKQLFVCWGYYTVNYVHLFRFKLLKVWHNGPLYTLDLLLLFIFQLKLAKFCFYLLHFKYLFLTHEISLFSLNGSITFVISPSNSH